MKKNNRLVTVLYIISRLSFRFSQLMLLFILLFEFVPNSAIGNFQSTMNYSNGYPIKARIELNIPDTIINYKRNNLKNMSSSFGGTISKTGTEKFNKEFNKEFNRIKKDDQLIKTYQMTHFEIYNNRKDIKNEFKTIKVQNPSSEVYVTVNPKNFFLKLILLVKNYLFLLLLLFVTYQCMRLFKELKTNFSFDKLLNKRIQHIGYSLILFQALNMIISIIIMYYLPRINYYYSSSIENLRFQFMTLSTFVEYNLEILFLGLCLLVLAKLFSYGFDLQNENELTI